MVSLLDDHLTSIHEIHSDIAIIFLAPISAFDQVLTEDRSVNRLVRVPLPSYHASFDHHSAGRQCPSVEGGLLEQVACQSRPSAVPQQVRYSGTEAEVRRTTAEVRAQLRRPSKRPRGRAKVWVYARVICVVTMLMEYPRRLQEQVQCHSPRTLADSPEILRLLYLRHRALCQHFVPFPSSRHAVLSGHNHYRWYHCCGYVHSCEII